MFRLLCAVALGLAFAVSATTGTTADPLTLKIHHFLPTSSTTHAKFLQVWAERVERQSGGRLTFRIFPSMQMGGKPPQLYDQVRDGVADLIWTLPGYTPGRFPVMEALELPFMVSTAEATSQAAWRFYDQYARDEFKDVHPLLLHVHARGSFHLRDTPVRQLADLDGLKIRAPSRTINAALSALGASPVGMPVPQVPQSLSKGVIDGAVIPYEVARALRVPELVKYHTEIGGPRGFYTAVFLFAMNKRVYDDLPPDLQKVIDDNSGLPLAQEIGRLWDEEEDVGRAAALSQGNEITVIPPEDLGPWRVATQPVIDDWVAARNQEGLDGAAMLDGLRTLIAGYDR
ncbi:TRAP transporter substrate-binding protein [Magnetospira thiophila]